MSYLVILPKSVQKCLDKLSLEVFERIMARLNQLQDDPRPPDVKRLKGRNGWRIRVGDYRILYDINDQELKILVITVGHRREVYR